MNYIYLGDCFEVLRDYIEDESIDLIYIDPPFNSKRNYNIFFDNKDIQSQRVAFEDTWTLRNINNSLIELNHCETEKLFTLLKAYQHVAPFAFPYLVMMAIRIKELHRVLKSTGSFYLHCDPTMSHYLKTICDMIFGNKNFRNEIIWSYHRWTNNVRAFTKTHDIILFYAKNYQSHKFNQLKENFSERSKHEASRVSQVIDGKLYQEYTGNNSRLKAMRDVWEISILNSQAKERIGYPTQKPLSLLERIIKASSNEDDMILDAFCGCGTTIDAAQRLKRKWIGIDVSSIAISLIDKRLKDTYSSEVIDRLPKYQVKGVPIDKQSAIKLWEQNPFAFQDWWVMEFEAFSSTFGSKGADKGLDGIAKYLTPTKEDKTKVINVGFQVKGGKVGSKDIDALIGAMDKHKCELGIFLSINNLTKPMLDTIGKADIITIGNKSYPKLQYLTITDFFNKKRFKLPSNNITFPKARHPVLKQKTFV